MAITDELLATAKDVSSNIDRLLGEKAELVQTLRNLVHAAKDVDLGRSVHNDRRLDGTNRIEGPVWSVLGNRVREAEAVLAAMERRVA